MNRYEPYKPESQREKEILQELKKFREELSDIYLKFTTELFLFSERALKRSDETDFTPWNGTDDGDNDGDDPGGLIEPENPNDAPKSWGDPKTLKNHFERHGKDFGATSPKDYAEKADKFYTRAQDENLPMMKSEDGVIRTYDPQTNTFGAYNPDGTTKTFFKPDGEGTKYFEKQINKGGDLINPLPEEPIVSEMPDIFIPE